MGPIPTTFKAYRFNPPNTPFFSKIFSTKFAPLCFQCFLEVIGKYYPQQNRYYMNNKYMSLYSTLTQCDTSDKLQLYLHSGNLTQLAGKWTRIEDVFPIKDGDIPLLC